MKVLKATDSRNLPFAAFFFESGKEETKTVAKAFFEDDRLTSCVEAIEDKGLTATIREACFQEEGGR